MTPLAWFCWALTVACAIAPTLLLRRPVAAESSRLRQTLAASLVARLSLSLLAFLAAVALLAPILTPYDPREMLDSINLAGVPPTIAHPLGTDQPSRDVLSRMLFGARVSLAVGLLSVLISLTVGTAYGAVSGMAGRRTDSVLMRIVDGFMSVPRALMLMAIVAIWGGVTVPALSLLIGVTGWFGVSRMVRVQVLAAREEDYFLAAIAGGASKARVFLRHVLPNVASPLVVMATMGVGHVIVLEAALSYIGIGVSIPTPSWGNMIRDGFEEMGRKWWLTLFPSLAIVATVMAINTLGDTLRDALDARQLLRHTGLERR